MSYWQARILQVLVIPSVLPSSRQIIVIHIIIVLLQFKLCDLFHQIQEQISTQPITQLSDLTDPPFNNSFAFINQSHTDLHFNRIMNTSKQQHDHNISFTDDFDSKYEQDQTKKNSTNHYTEFVQQPYQKYQLQIAKLTEELLNKNQRIFSLQQQICELKSQQDYLIIAIQELRDKNNLNALELDAKTEKIMKIKQNQIEYLKKQVSKLKEWLKQEKAQAFRCIQCVKMKDSIIDNLQKQNQKLKQQIRPKRKIKKSDNIGNTMGQQDEQAKQIKRTKKLQEQVEQLTEQIHNLRYENASYKNELSKLQKIVPKNEQPQSPIFKLQSKKFSQISQSEDISRKQTVSNQQNTNLKLMSSKCMHLEAQMQKLINQIIYLKTQNNKLNKFYESPPLARQQTYMEEVLKQEHFQFGQ